VGFAKARGHSHPFREHLRLIRQAAKVCTSTLPQDSNSPAITPPYPARTAGNVLIYADRHPVDLMRRQGHVPLRISSFFLQRIPATMSWNDEGHLTQWRHEGFRAPDNDKTESIPSTFWTSLGFARVAREVVQRVSWCLFTGLSKGRQKFCDLGTEFTGYPKLYRCMMRRSSGRHSGRLVHVEKLANLVARAHGRQAPLGRVLEKDYHFYYVGYDLARIGLAPRSNVRALE